VSSIKPGLEDLLTVSSAAQLLLINRKTLYRLISERRVPFIRKPGIGYRLKKSDIQQWLEEGYERPDGWKNRL